MSTPVSSPASPPRRKWSPLRIAGIGCGGIAAFFVLFLIVGAVLLQVERGKPFSATSEVSALAGVPLYPGATIDEDATRDGRAVALLLRGLYPADSTTVVGFRTADRPQNILAFYDRSLARFGFTKTRLGGGAGDAGASYIAEGVTIVIQLREEEDEDRQLFVMRFDNGKKSVLRQPEDIVTPEDFKRAAEAAAKEATAKKAAAKKEAGAPAGRGADAPAKE